MARPEASIERPLVAEAEAEGWLSYKVTFLNRKGAPDRIFGKDGRTVVMEFKEPGPGGSLSKSQERCHVELRRWFGWETHVVKSMERGRMLLGLKGGIDV